MENRFIKYLFFYSIMPLCLTFFVCKVNASSSSNYPALCFSVISDIHLRAGNSDWGYPYHDLTAQRKFKNALLDMHNINPNMDGLIINGDLTVTGMQKDYDDMLKVLYSSPHPKTTLFAIGNHEFNSAYRNQQNGILSIKTFPNGVTEKSCIIKFLKNTGMPYLYYDKWIKGYHFIVLGSERSCISNYRNTGSAVLSDTQLKWLDEKLKETPKNKPIFVFLHQPLPNTVAGSYKDDIYFSQKLRNVLNNYPQVLFFSGHSHRTLKNEAHSMYKDKFSMFNDSCVRNPCTPNHRFIGDSEGLYVQAYHDKVVVRGRDFTHHTWINQYTINFDT